MTKKKKSSYSSSRIRLEKLKQKTWLLVVLTRLLVFLASLMAYLGRS